MSNYRIPKAEEHKTENIMNVPPWVWKIEAEYYGIPGRAGITRKNVVRWINKIRSHERNIGYTQRLITDYFKHWIGA